MFQKNGKRWFARFAWRRDWPGGMERRGKCAACSTSRSANWRRCRGLKSHDHRDDCPFCLELRAEAIGGFSTKPPSTWTTAPAGPTKSGARPRDRGVPPRAGLDRGHPDNEFAAFDEVRGAWREGLKLRSTTARHRDPPCGRAGCGRRVAPDGSRGHCRARDVAPARPDLHAELTRRFGADAGAAPIVSRAAPTCPSEASVRASRRRTDSIVIAARLLRSLHISIWIGPGRALSGASVRGQPDRRFGNHLCQ
jgi:hypothetical protein